MYCASCEKIEVTFVFLSSWCCNNNNFSVEDVKYCGETATFRGFGSKTRKRTFAVQTQQQQKKLSLDRKNDSFPLCVCASVCVRESRQQKHQQQQRH